MGSNPIGSFRMAKLKSG